MVYEFFFFAQLTALKFCAQMIVNELAMHIESIPPENEVLYRQVDAIIKVAQEIANMVDDFFGASIVFFEEIVFGWDIQYLPPRHPPICFERLAISLMRFRLLPNKCGAWPRRFGRQNSGRE